MKRPMVAGWLLAGGLLLFAGLANADEAVSLFNQANKFYEMGDYQQAIMVYEKILAAGKVNWQVYFNLGNAYYKQKRYGKAILNYERARRLSRDNEDIEFNLDLANLSVADRITAMPRSLMVVWLDNAIHFFTVTTAATIMLIFWLVIFAGTIIWMLARRELLQNWGRRLAWAAGAVWLIFALFFGLLAYERATVQEGIVLVSRVVVRSSPSDEATEMFILHEGVKVRLQDSSGNWRRIKLADGKVGWLEAKAIEKI
jgi:tetratricopeptide (TPR) repeat protein